MRFCTVINCMDGRVQLPVIQFLKERFGVDYVDNITEPGPDGILAHRDHDEQVASILHRAEVSINKHGSVGLAVVGHADCAGNPVTPEEHRRQIKDAVRLFRQKFPAIPVIGLWLSETWSVEEIPNEADM